ncbi:Prolyl-tRNA synthetase [Fructilactobacillus florum 8D]|uniref:Proline--tRNA ligase n=1 Tax=Fructilactobacillus florum 8D TaxID=1221538 RepID=W9EFT4_9LACO|nr:proline--tRNA ligase [Fructilactobacillus florum]EKK20222.1 Prolyl-tRNA synthetase [Fructilactobacillus florum 2F]ETO40907.1 Prolyl-tRNA synthetase [Fructilactobacillus florum 8D]
MRQSKILIPTQKQDPAGAEALSHKLLLRAGFIRQISAGNYAYLPLAYRVLARIKTIIREELDRTDATEMLLPTMIPAEFWKKSGRYAAYGPELFRLKNRHDTDFILGPTHEETVTELIKATVSSYKKLPLNIYQIQSKYRDEDRPRYGLLRSREFMMLDSYSFAASDEDLDQTYRAMRQAFTKIFDRIGLDYQSIIGDSGSMGGSDSMEFSAPAAVGEDTIVYSDNSEYAANLEMATNLVMNKKSHAEPQSLQVVATANCKNVADVAALLEVSTDQIIKSLLYDVDGQLVLVLLRGSQTVNENKLQNFFNADRLQLADAIETKGQVLQDGTLALPSKMVVVADEYVHGMVNGVIGAPAMAVIVNSQGAKLPNVDLTTDPIGKHYTGFNPSRDFPDLQYGDFRMVNEGDISPDGSGVLHFTKGIEVGHIFKLGTRYSTSLDATILDENGRQQPVIMGCYGIGVSRLLSAVTEQQADENGLIWPRSIAPFDVHVLPINIKDEKQRTLAEQITTNLENDGLEVLLDDRKERAGVKFADADLIGIPIRITLGKKVAEDIVEVKIRKTGETIETRVDDLKNTIDILAKNI